MVESDAVVEVQSSSSSKSKRSGSSKEATKHTEKTTPTLVVEETTTAVAEEEPRPETTDTTQTVETTKTAPTAPTTNDGVKRRVRRVVDRDSILAEFDKILVQQWYLNCLEELSTMVLS